MMQTNIVVIIKIQAFVRRFLSRKAIKSVVETRDMYRMHARYFQREETFETLKLQPMARFRSSEVREYRYRNGAVYQGQWRGNFRDGKGRMEWSDGAFYEGTWELGYASGQGVFVDCLGNRYVGGFQMSMAHG